MLFLMCTHRHTTNAHKHALSSRETNIHTHTHLFVYIHTRSPVPSLYVPYFTNLKSVLKLCHNNICFFFLQYLFLFYNTSVCAFDEEEKGPAVHRVATGQLFTCRTQPILPQKARGAASGDTHSWSSVGGIQRNIAWCYT